MADFNYDGFVDTLAPAQAGGRVKRWTNGAGALLSVALIAGLAVWGYQLAVRDARGVPVVRALAGPMRIAPDDPGGEQMAHQGLAVNNVAAVGEVAAPADRLLLAPRPVELSDEDQAGFAPIPASAVVPTLTATIPFSEQFPQEGTSTRVLEGDVAAIDAEPEPVPVVVAAVAPPEVATSPLADPGLVARADSGQIVAPAPLLAATALADPGPDQVEPDQAGVVQTGVVQAAVDLVVAEAVAAADPEPVIGGTAAAVTTSQRPRQRPPRAASAAQPVTAPAATETTSLVAGTRLVQLGAYDDEATAAADWDKLKTGFTAYFEGKSQVIQKAESGGRVFYRLRAHGFADEDEARRFCAVLLNERAQCIPVLIR